MHSLSVAEMASALTEGQCTSEELVQVFLDRIARFDTQINSLITVDPERALAQARVGLEVMDLNAACRTYNILVSEDRRVAAALLFE